MAKKKRKKTRIQKSWETYKRWYKEYSSRNLMKDDMLSKSDYAALRARAHEYGQSTVNFARTVASRQREASELQVLTTWSIVKDNLAFIRSLDPENRTEKEKEILQKYDEISLKEYRIKIKEVLSKLEETIDRSDWEEQFEMAFDSPKEKSVARAQYRERKGKKKKKIRSGRPLPTMPNESA